MKADGKISLISIPEFEVRKALTEPPGARTVGNTAGPTAGGQILALPLGFPTERSSLSLPIC